ncbi:tetratricopeptide repeat protein [Clostridium gasigenes]|uniref:ATP-binding protein n=1 Tax=Clostridium gasigenes TaxID=94869 RepID=UPI001C0BBA00|nr:ATP-binding protein [Clostridium gasigenes]MBU3132351.1 tetratricopeptide repeat protein [Clostridium gasigenes]
MKHQYFEIEISSYIDKLMNNHWNETLMGNTKTIFLNTKNSDKFSLYMDSYLQSISEKTKIFRQRIYNTNFSKPYYPFFDFIKETVKLKNRKEIQDFVEKSDVYYFQQPVFISYFYGEPIQRKEAVILGELDYEKNRMHQSILNLYGSLSKNTPMIVVIEDIHHAKQSTLELIQHIIKTKEKNNIFFIFSFNKEYQFEIQEKQKQWDEFIQCIHTYDSIIDVEILKDIKKDYCKEKKEDQVLELEKIIDLSMESFHFFALQEAKEYITTVYDQRVINNTCLTPIYFLRMLHLLGDIYCSLEENDIAFMHYHDLLNFSKKSNNVKEISYCYQKMGLIYWKKGNRKRAERLGKQSLQIALQLQDEMLILNSNFLLLLIDDPKNKEGIKQFKKLYYDSIKIAEKFNMQNALAYYYTNPCIVAIMNEEDCIKFYDYGISIAKKYNNKYRLSVAHHSQGISYILKGKYHEALKYHKKSEKLKLELENNSEIACIFNGLGFNYFIIENYEEAYLYYNKALEYLKKLKNYNQIAITLFNIANNYFLDLQHKLSIQYLEKLLLLINSVKIDSIYYHTLYGIYSLIGINYCKLGEISKAYEYMIKIKNIRSFCYIDEDKFWVELFKSLSYKIEGDYEKATFHFEVAMTYIQKIKYMAPRFYYEYGLMKKEQGKKEEAESLFKTGIQYCEELQYSFHKNLLLKELGDQRNIKEPLQLYNKFYDLQWISDYIQEELIKNNLHKKINEINFLNILQEIIGREKKKEELIKNVMNLIHDTFFVEYSFLYLKEDNQWKCIYCNQVLEVDYLDTLTLIETLTKERRITIIPNVSEDLKYRDIGSTFFSIINIPLIDNDELVGNILCATQKEGMIFDIDDTKILSMTSKQLINALRKIKKDDEILQKNKELYAANESERLKTEFLCNLSHEFRTPLNVILSSLQVLGLNVKDNKESKYFRIIKQNCYRLLRLINNLIDISKIDSEFYKTNLENHNIVNVLEEITLSIVPYLKLKGISLQFDTDVEEKIMGCDVDQMERVILNLLSNSIKFTQYGGEIAVNFYDKGKNVLIIIKDTGIGIPKNKLHMIFKRFGQVDRSLTRNHEGSGIGLCIVKSIVEMWGANISIESEYGKGSTFTIEIPVTVLPEKNSCSKENNYISSNLVERTQVEFSDIYF